MRLFERDLLDHLIPSIEPKYPVLVDPEHRVLAGLSMGGGQTLYFDIGHIDGFFWLGAFSAAPSTHPPAGLVADLAAVQSRLRLLYLSCGNKDGLISVSQGTHARPKELEIPHTWNVDDRGHDGATLGSNLHHFAQRIFR